MARVLLVRHGHVEGIDPPRFRGHQDVPLTEEGRRQARAAAACIAARWHPSIVYLSPLKRCVQTGSDIAAACAVRAVVVEGLNDLDYGAWQWMTHEEVRGRWPQLLERWFAAPQLVRFPGGESLQDLIARTADVLRMVLERHAHDTVVLVGHDSGIRTLLLQMLDQPISAYWRLAPQPASVSEVEISAGEVRVLGINETRHLEAG
jgi:phosphoserine phosphatase